MSRSISVALKNHLASDVTTLAMLWKVIRRDGQVFGFTDHDADLTVDGVLYAAATGFNASAVSTSAAFNVDNLDVDGIFSAAAITEADILSGVWDNAEVLVFLCNWADLTQGVMKLRRGWLGQAKTGRGTFTTELRGLMQRVQQNVGEVYSPNCRADLGDTRCKVVLTPFTFTATVTTAVTRRTFNASSLTQADNYFAFGQMTWTSGANNGLAMEIKSSLSSGGAIALQLPMPFDIVVGDTFSIVTGCDRTLATCRDKFANVLNYRGEPYLPGIDQVMLYGKNGI